MLQVRISTRPTLLSLHSQPATLELRSRRAEVQTSSTPARLAVRQSEVRLTVDNSACREALGLYDVAGFSAMVARQGAEAAQQAEHVFALQQDFKTQIRHSAPSFPANCPAETPAAG